MKTRHATPSLAAFIALLFVGFAALGGCKPSEEELAKEQKPPVPKVTLPPSPEMVEPRVVETYVDGSYTVAGLIKQQAKVLGHTVKVKGHIAEIRRCGPDDGQCDLPDHAVLVDDLARATKRILLLGGTDTIFDELQQGEKRTLEGLYVQSDPEGWFVRMEGVLMLPPVPPKEEPDEEETDEAQPDEGQPPTP